MIPRTLATILLALCLLVPGALAQDGDPEGEQDPSPPENETGEEEQDQEDRDEEDGDRDEEGDDGPASEDRRGGPGQSPPGASRARGPGQTLQAPAQVDLGRVTFTWTGEGVSNLTLDGTLLLEEVTVQGLGAEEARVQQHRFEVRSEDARLRILAQDRLILQAESDEGTIRAQLGPGLQASAEDDRAQVRGDGLLGTVRGEDLRVTDAGLHATEELLLTVSTAQEKGRPAWVPTPRAPAMELPITIEGRYLSFHLNETGVHNLTVHGIPLGDVHLAPGAIEEARHTGARVEIEAAGLELEAIDAPATQLRIEGDGLTADVPMRTELPSGAQLQVRISEDELRLTVAPPKGGIDTTPGPRLDRAPVEARFGPTPGLSTGDDRGRLDVSVANGSTLRTEFHATDADDPTSIGLELDLVRALLIQDVDRDGQVDIGEPALAQADLTNGSTTVEDDTLVTVFPLWSGNLTVVTELGEQQAKVTYGVEDLRAPEGTLFVLEARAKAPPGLALQASGNGVTVHNGSLQAAYTPDGPVTVDGTPAWAHQAVLVQADGTASILTTYPAGDTMSHDPTISVQSVGQTVTGALSAAPAAVVIGAALGLLVVGTTVYSRRAGQGPRR